MEDIQRLQKKNECRKIDTEHHDQNQEAPFLTQCAPYTTLRKSIIPIKKQEELDSNI